MAKIDVVIVNWNTGPFLYECVLSLLNYGKKSIQDIKMKQIKQLKKWEEENPLFITNENLLNQWQKMVKEIIGPEENAKTKEKDIFYIKKQLANTIPVKFALKNK